MSLLKRLQEFWGCIHRSLALVPDNVTYSFVTMCRMLMSEWLQEFWGRIHRSLALVPSFGMPVYYESRISSTITASLVTCERASSH
jgi:hypothetical protein